jgi:hypothetical protein
MTARGWTFYAMDQNLIHEAVPRDLAILHRWALPVHHHRPSKPAIQTTMVWADLGF